ncbi:MAG: hypothetical protein AAF633_23365 [Chloroflexota bacterium]
MSNYTYANLEIAVARIFKASPEDIFCDQAFYSIATFDPEQFVEQRHPLNDIVDRLSPLWGHLEVCIDCLQEFRIYLMLCLRHPDIKMNPRPIIPSRPSTHPVERKPSDPSSIFTV